MDLELAPVVVALELEVLVLVVVAWELRRWRVRCLQSAFQVRPTFVPRQIISLPETRHESKTEAKFP